MVKSYPFTAIIRLPQLTLYVINDNATIAEAVVVRIHPLMLQIVASPGVELVSVLILPTLSALNAQ